MAEFGDAVRDTLGRLDALAVLDIVIIAFVFYWALLLFRGTTAMTLLRGAAIILIAAFLLGRVLDLRVLNFVLRNSLTGVIIAIPIIFQPEIRRALERVGRTGFRVWPGRTSYEGVVDAVSETALYLARQQHGAIMVLERETGLQEYIDTGVRLDAATSAELLEDLFYPNSPLHDGAVILRAERVVAASCTLPLSENRLPPEMSTRHRAGLGITERSDAVSVVVSEETGQISLAADGRMYTRLDEGRLRGLLYRLMAERRIGAL
jgi:diadenylate cyclase